MRHVALLAGPVSYDLSGTGWSWSAAIRADYPVARALGFEGGLTYFRYQTQFSAHEAFLFPEVGVHLGLPTKSVRPYLLGGLGIALAIEGAGDTEITGHAGLGIRTALPGPYGARVEARFRNITFTNNASFLEVLVGLSRRW
jgi:hypothetical protein